MGGTHNKKIYHRLMQEGAACCFFLEGKDARVLPLNLGQVRGGGGGAAARTDPPETGMPCFLLSSIPQAVGWCRREGECCRRKGGWRRRPPAAHSHRRWQGFRAWFGRMRNLEQPVTALVRSPCTGWRYVVGWQSSMILMENGSSVETTEIDGEDESEGRTQSSGVLARSYRSSPSLLILSVFSLMIVLQQFFLVVTSDPAPVGGAKCLRGNQETNPDYSAHFRPFLADRDNSDRNETVGRNHLPCTWGAQGPTLPTVPGQGFGCNGWQGLRCQPPGCSMPADGAYTYHRLTVLRDAVTPMEEVKTYVSGQKNLTKV